jgi:hypothetical protein
MFHTLSELKEKEKNNGKPIPNKSITSMPKERTPKDNYYGKGNKAYDYYNKKPSENVNTNFEKTKNKITLIVFKNGFIIDNGPFRDGSIPENQKFMEQVEKGYIPHELTDKGINDLGILLINRKSEVYYQQMGPVTHITQITQINPINPITINPNVNSYNQYTNYDNIFNNYTYSYILNTASKYNEQYEQLLNQVLYNSNNNSLNNYNQYVYNPVIQTPMGNRSIRREIFVPKDNVDIPNTETRDYKRTERHTSSVPKKEPKNRFETFHNFKRQELIKEEEEKKRKNKINMNKEKKETKEEKKEEKKFTAFGGTGQAIGNINTEGLNVQTDLKNSINIFKPVCTINIRLFNGEIAKGEFNYTQTLRDIYFYVRKISGSNNFTLLDGFPPKPLRDYDRTIGQLKLENSTLTQRLNS